MPNNLKCTDWRPDCCILYLLYIQEKSLKANTEQHFFTDSQTELGLFLPPSAIRGLNQTWNLSWGSTESRHAILGMFFRCFILIGFLLQFLFIILICVFFISCCILRSLPVSFWRHVKYLYIVGLLCHIKVVPVAASYCNLSFVINAILSGRT